MKKLITTLITLSMIFAILTISYVIVTFSDTRTITVVIPLITLSLQLICFETAKYLKKKYKV